MQRTLAIAGSLLAFAACRTTGTNGEPSPADGATGTAAPLATSAPAASVSPSATAAAPEARPRPPPTAPFAPGKNRATLTGKPFPALEGPPDPAGSLRKTIAVKLSKPNADFTLGRGFLLRDRKDDDRARWFVLRIANTSPSLHCGLRVVYAQFHDGSDRPVGAGHNVGVHGSIGEVEQAQADARLVLPGVGVFFSDDCLGPGEAGYAIIDLASEDDCAAKHPCSPGAADLGAVELELRATTVRSGVGPATQVVPTSYDASPGSVSVTVTNRGPNPAALVLAQALALDASGDPLFFMKLAVDPKRRIAPGESLPLSASPTYHGAPATRLAAWVLYAEAAPP